MSSGRRCRDQRGVVFPSPVVILSIVAVAMAGIAYVATQNPPATEREVTTVARPGVADQRPPRALPSKKPQQLERKKKEPSVQRSRVYVVVFNNSGISGLAGRYAGRASGAGWQVVGSDNWYGTIPASTVYYPERLRAAAELLALDLGIDRMLPAVAPMQLDRLTVVLTADAA